MSGSRCASMPVMRFLGVRQPLSDRYPRAIAKLLTIGPLAALLLAGCAALPPSPGVSACLQPNRRVDVEVSGMTGRPQGFSTAARVATRPVRFEALAQGDSAFDVGAAILKVEGRGEFDRLAVEIARRKVDVGSIVVIGHTDKLEAERFPASLSEERAKAVVAYLHSKGMDKGLIFWEGKGATDPLPVTRFCD